MLPISAMTLKVLAGSANMPLATSISTALGVKLCERIVQRFADGELHVDIEESVRGHDVYVVEPPAFRATSTLWSCSFWPTPAVAPARPA